MSRFYLMLASRLQLQYFFFCVAPGVHYGNGGKHMFGTSQLFPAPAILRGWSVRLSGSVDEQEALQEDGSKVGQNSMPVISCIQGYMASICLQTTLACSWPGSRVCSGVI